MSESTAALLDRLRKQIRKLEAQPRALLTSLRTGVEVGAAPLRVGRSWQ